MVTKEGQQQQHFDKFDNHEHKGNHRNNFKNYHLNKYNVTEMVDGGVKTVEINIKEFASSFIMSNTNDCFHHDDFHHYRNENNKDAGAAKDNKYTNSYDERKNSYINDNNGDKKNFVRRGNTGNVDSIGIVYPSYTRNRWYHNSTQLFKSDEIRTRQLYIL